MVTKFLFLVDPISETDKDTKVECKRGSKSKLGRITTKGRVVSYKNGRQRNRTF